MRRKALFVVYGLSGNNSRKIFKGLQGTLSQFFPHAVIAGCGKGSFHIADDIRMFHIVRWDHKMAPFRFAVEGRYLVVPF